MPRHDRKTGRVIPPTEPTPALDPVETAMAKSELVRGIANAGPLPTAARLILEAQAATVLDPCDQAVAELRTVIAYNDVASPAKQVTPDKSIALLRAYGWQGTDITDLNALAQRRLGRRSYASR